MTERPWPWKPIDTAPRDGKVVLARQGGYYPHVMYWKDGHWYDAITEVEHVPTHWLPGAGDGEQGVEK